MREPEKLIEVLKRNQWVIKAQTDGLSHDECLLQLPFRGNCLNWVLGHIAVHRDKVLPLLGKESVLDEAAVELYRRGSEPIQQGAEALLLGKLLEALDQIQERVAAELGRVSPDELAALYDEERGHSVGDRIEFLLWHETYHVGQLEYLRQLAGKDDTVI